ncbi:MAG: hypothetical protein V1652_03935 [bacterium]
MVSHKKQEKKISTLSSVIELLKKSLATYFHNFFAFVCIGLFPAILSLMLSSSFPQLHLGNSLAPFYYALLLAYLIAWILHWPAWFTLIRYQQGIAHALRVGTENFFDYWLTFFLLCTTVVGASLFFIIPGILLFIVLSFSIYIVAFEKQNGLQALLKSRALSMNMLWYITIRYLVLSALYFAAIKTLQGIVFIFHWDIMTASVISLILTDTFLIPFILITGSHIYRDVRHIQSKPSNQSLSEKILLTLFCVLGIPFIATCIYVYGSNAFWLDEAPHNDRDLQMTVVQISDEENAFFDLQKAHKILSIPEEMLPTLQEHARGEVWDQSFVDMILAQNKLTLSFFEAASEKGRFQIPMYSDPSNPHHVSDIDFLSTFSVIHVAEINARSHANKGEDSLALEEAFRIVRIGYLIEMSRNSKVEHAFGGTVRETGLALIRDLTQTSKLPTQDLQRYAQKLGAYSDTSLGLLRTLNEEYLIIKKALDDFSPTVFETKENYSSPFALFGEIQTNHDNLSSFHYKPHKTQRLLAQSFRDAMNRVREECGIAIFNGKIESTFDVVFIHPLLTENSVGKTFLSRSVLGSATADHLTSCNMELSTAATQTILALRAYYNQKGFLPETLDPIIEYVPTDPFSPIKIPLEYVASQACIYSVGSSHMNIGGSFETPWKTSQNPTFCFTFK